MSLRTSIGGPIRVRITEEIDPGTQNDRRNQALPEHLRAGADDLAGWPAASAGRSTAHVDGILDGRVAGQGAQGVHDTHQAGVASAKRHSDERESHHDGIFLSVTTTCSRRSRSPRIRSSSRSRWSRRRICCSIPRRRRTNIRRGCSVRPMTKFLAAIRHTSRTTCRQESVSHRVRGDARPAGPADARRRRDDVSAVHATR